MQRGLLGAIAALGMIAACGGPGTDGNDAGRNGGGDGNGGGGDTGADSGNGTGRGWLDVVTIPTGALVTLDGAETRRETPCTLEMNAGEHEVVLRKQGYQPATRRVTVVADRNVGVEVHLVPEGGGFQVRVLIPEVPPPPLVIWLNGSPIGVDVPGPIAVPGGTHTFSVGLNSDDIGRFRGFVRIPQTVEVTASMDVRVPLGRDLGGWWNCDRNPTSRNAEMYIVEEREIRVRDLDEIGDILVEGDALSLALIGLTGSVLDDGRTVEWTDGVITVRCTR